MFERKKSAGKIYFLPIDQIHPSPFQARRTFEEQELAGLAQSIRENGLLQPISVRKAAEGYELVAGERRLRACKLAQMTTIPAILCSYADEQTAALGLLENIQRTDLNPFEQAQGLRDILVLWDCTQAEAAKRLGMAQPTLANKPHRASRAGRAAPAGEPPQRGAHQHCQAAAQRPSDRPVHRTAAQQHRKRAAPHLHGPGCAHLCEHHRPCHPTDDRQWGTGHGPPGREGWLHRIHGAHPHGGSGEVNCSMWNRKKRVKNLQNTP